MKNVKCIDLYPTHTILYPYERGDNTKLEKSLSVWDPVSFKYEFSAFLIDDEEHKLLIPSGFNLAKLKTYYPNALVNNYKNNYSNFRVVNNYNLKSLPRDKIQTDAINFLLNIHNVNNKPSQKFLCLKTGLGKTYCAINYCNRCKKLPMIILDQETLAVQWTDSILKFTDLNEENIYFISGKKSIDKLYKMEKEDLNKIYYFIAIHRTLANIFEEDSDKLKELFEYLKIGLKIYDEAHIEYKNIFYIDSATHIETIYLTATPERSNPNEKNVYNNMFLSIDRHKPKVNDRYITLVAYYVNTKCPDFQSIKFKTKRGFDTIAYCKYFADSEYFEGSLIKIIEKIFNGDYTKKKNIVIVYKLKKQLEEAKNILENLFKEKNVCKNIGILSGDTKDKNSVKDNDIIITTDSSFTKGVDIKDLDIVINFVPIGSESKLIQLTGRLRKPKEYKSVFFIDVIDESVLDLARQFKTRFKYYEKNFKNMYRFYYERKDK